jgi:hypothetical protein
VAVPMKRRPSLSKTSARASWPKVASKRQRRSFHIAQTCDAHAARFAASEGRLDRADFRRAVTPAGHSRTAGLPELRCARDQIGASCGLMMARSAFCTTAVHGSPVPFLPKEKGPAAKPLPWASLVAA